MKGGGIHKGGELFWIQQLLTHLYTKSKNLSKQNSSKLSDNVQTLSKARYKPRFAIHREILHIPLKS